MRDTNRMIRFALTAIVTAAAVIGLMAGAGPVAAAAPVPITPTAAGPSGPTAPDPADDDPAAPDPGEEDPGAGQAPAGQTPGPEDAQPVPAQSVPTEPDAPALPPAGVPPRIPTDRASGSQDDGGGTVTSTTVDPASLGARVFRGMGFEACTAPGLETMEAWRDASPYRAIGIYIGGRARSCAQPKLTRSWVRSVTDMGWNLLPIWVGSQSPCVGNERQRQYPIDADRADEQGGSEAAEAVRAASALGILRGSPVYLDMESYGLGSARCTDPVLDFTQGWSRGLRDRGYFPGFYSSSDAGITQIEQARADGRPDLPDLLWFARWNDSDTVYSEPDLPGDVWRPHRRIHQYVGDTRETYDGYSLDIDRDLVDAPVAIVG